MNDIGRSRPQPDTSLAPGEARCPGVTVQQILATDRIPPPPVMLEESYVFLGDADLGAERYTSQEFFNLEMERMWKRVWQWACREDHIPEAGDYYVYDIGRTSIIVMRTETGDIKAYYNVCQHRGTKLRWHEGIGHGKEIRCPFHGWSWALDGTLKDIPCRWDFPHVDSGKFGLAEVRTETWGGFVFVNMDENAPPLMDYLAPLPEHMSHIDLKRRYVEIHFEKELACNWKSAVEAFIEGYHILETHPQLLYTLGDANTQYDLYGDHVSRFLELVGISSPHVEPLSTREMLARMFVSDPAGAGAEHEIGEQDSARSIMAEYLRGVLGKKYGVDLSRCSDMEMIDPVQYTLFPNMFVHPGIGIPMIYRVRPVGMDPGRSRLEVLVMRPLADGAEMPDPPDPIKVPEEIALSTIPELEPSLALAFDQDTGNLRAQQDGYHFVNKGLTLANYQEIRVRHLHHTLDKYLNGEK